ncbi:putative transcription factor interactor and regulator CCHC(Zn) family [Medicago truncatula]|uniref:Putative transcription factor interactor and regulator CCHC(Zn) family n=2 Tax=Medicago truncatula TaxID=3880 RepID=A0A396JWJ8_MEDTR|nr:putative transcription factor interactor and regulator CCHC(Zn) family [Medicago truncatula]
MAEWIRTYLMNRMSTNRLKLQNWNHKIMPMPRKRLNTEIVKSGGWVAIWGVAEEFEVHQVGGSQAFTVNLAKKTCSCNFWELVGIPCRHAIAAMSKTSKDPEDYVSDWYSREMYEKCYTHNVSAINGQDMWPEVECEELLPPAYKKGPGRPKKVRRREADEAPSSQGKYKRYGTTYRCTKCDKFRHNAKGCKSLTVNPNAQKRKRKPPRQPSEARTSTSEANAGASATDVNDGASASASASASEAVCGASTIHGGESTSSANESVQGASKKRKVGSNTTFIPPKQSKKSKKNPMAFMSSSVKPSANVQTTVHTTKKSHTLIEPTANVTTTVHTSSTSVRPTATVNTVVHTSKSSHTVVKPTANVTTVINPKPTVIKKPSVKPGMHRKPPRKPTVRTLDVVRAIVEPIVKVKAPIRKSRRIVWKGPAIKNGPGKDLENPIEVVDEEVEEAGGSEKHVAEATPRKLTDAGGSCLALLRSVENVKYI